MAAPNRQAILTACHKVTKKHYQPAEPDTRSLLDQMAYAAILENSPRKSADLCFEELTKRYYDWNEVRVTSIAELCEVMTKLPQAASSARNLKNLFQSVFETLYSYDLEGLKKLNQGKAVKQLEKFRGATPFIIGYVTQHGLGGHSIPVDDALLELMKALGVINDNEARKKSVPGMERAIPKTKGIEFASLVHELAVRYHATPFSKKYRDIILEIAPDAKQRFPKRSSSKDAEEKKTTTKKKVATKKKTVTKKTVAAKPAPAKKKVAAKKAPTKKKAAAPAKKKTATKKTAKKSSASITKRKPK